MQNLYSPATYRTSIMLLLTLFLSACGFHLRGSTADLSFKQLFIQGSTLSITRDLTQSLKANGIKITDSSEHAELLLDLISEASEKRILSLSGRGLVREFELSYKVSFRTRTPDSPTWSQVQTIQARRDFSYDDKALLGKAEEEARLNADMRNDALREIIRRLSTIKPAEKTVK